MNSFAENSIVRPVQDQTNRPQADSFEYQSNHEMELDFESHIHLIMKALDFEKTQLQALAG